MPDSDPKDPAAWIRAELDSRGWRQRDLAFVLGVTEQSVTALATGKRGISAEMAKALARVFDRSPEFILGLQKSSEIQMDLVRADEPSPDVARRAKLVAGYPIREMVKRGWLTADNSTLEAQAARFFAVANMDEKPTLPHLAKKSNYTEDVPAPQLAWLFRVKQIAERLIVPSYSESALRDAIPKLRALLTDPGDSARAPEILNNCGIRFVVVEGLPGSRIDGVAFWLNGGKSPVIGMSLLHDRMDNFWFVLRHEIEHVLARHNVETVNMDVELIVDKADVAGELPVEEREANTAAADFCVPKAKMESFFARKNPFFSENDIIGFSRLTKVHPSLVAGQIRNRTKRYDSFSKLMTKVRSAVTSAAVVDGWGETYPIPS